MLRSLIVLATAALLASCGSAPVGQGTSQQSSPTPAAPSYQQVLEAIRTANSVHFMRQSSTVTLDLRSNAAGTVSGTFTVPGAGSMQFFSDAKTFEAVADAQFIANCGCHVKPTPGVCQVFTTETLATVGLAPSDLAAFTPAGIVISLNNAAAVLSLDGRTTVNGTAVYAYKGSGREMDVPVTGTPLPVRLARTGTYDSLFSEWNTAVPTKPASC